MVEGKKGTLSFGEVPMLESEVVVRIRGLGAAGFGPSVPIIRETELQLKLGKRAGRNDDANAIEDARNIEPRGSA